MLSGKWATSKRKLKRFYIFQPFPLFHFFKSFCDAASCNLSIEVSGENEHHKIEAVFKGFARALRNAVRLDPDDNKLPTTKGKL